MVLCDMCGKKADEHWPLRIIAEGSSYYHLLDWNHDVCRDCLSQLSNAIIHWCDEKLNKGKPCSE